MKRLLALLILLASTPVAAQQTPAANADPRLQIFTYDPSQVTPLQIPMGFQTTIVLNPDEQIESLALGDSGAWQATPNARGDHLFIKPLRGGSTTNLTVVTDARVYSFELSAGYGSAANTPFVVRFTYPSAETGSVTAQTRLYRLSGARALRPHLVSDDGVRTLIEWRPDQSLPAVFALDDRGHEVLVDSHMREGRLVIDAVYPILLFRLDRQTARATRLESRDRR